MDIFGEIGKIECKLFLDIIIFVIVLLYIILLMLNVKFKVFV